MERNEVGRALSRTKLATCALETALARVNALAIGVSLLLPSGAACEDGEKRYKGHDVVGPPQSSSLSTGLVGAEISDDICYMSCCMYGVAGGRTP